MKVENGYEEYESKCQVFILTLMLVEGLKQQMLANLDDKVLSQDGKGSIS